MIIGMIKASDTKSDAKYEQPEARWQSHPHRHRWLVRLI